jgi:DNA-binding Lrp family transcriptional regulator
MEALNKQILDILREDARLNADAIAVMLGADSAAVQKAIAAMEADGTIIKYMTVINDDRYDDDGVEALIEVKVTPKLAEGYDAVAEEIYKFPQVRSVFLMSGSYDLLVTVSGRNLRTVAKFVAENLSTLDAVTSTATRFILKKYKVEGVTLSAEEENGRLPVQP